MTTITVKVGGSLVEDEAQITSLAEQVALLHDAGLRVCLVHGGGPQTTQALAAEGIPEHRHDGLRVTPPEAADVVRRELDAVGKTLAAHLARQGLQVYHADSHQQRLSAQVKPSEHDLGRVGEPTGFDAMGLPGPVDGPVQVVTPIGFDNEGPLNVNADEAAACIAPAIGSDALAFVTDVEGVKGPRGETFDALSPCQARDLVETGTAQGGMIPKLQAGVEALSAGVGRVHVVPAVDGGLTSLRQAGPTPGTELGAPGVPA